MAAVDGVREVHDLHIWTVTSDFPALAAHVIVDHDEDVDAVRERIERCCTTTSTSTTPRCR